MDDGSPDNCPAMCDAWAEKDSRVKVIHKGNGGLSDARNAGMAVATGEFVGFVDSDDYIVPEMYRLLYERMVADGSDIVACGVEMVFEDGSPARLLTKTGSCILDQMSAMEAVIRETWLKQPVWYKLYRTALIRDILFPVGKYHEDVFWTWQAVARAEKVSVFDTPCYSYVQRSGSIMGETYSLRRLDAVEAKRERLEFLEKSYPKLADYGRKDLLFTCMYHGQLALRDLEKTEREQVFLTLKPIVSACPNKDTQLPRMHRCWLCLAKTNLLVVCWIRNFLGLGL